MLWCLKVQICKNRLLRINLQQDCLQIWTLIHHSTQPTLIFSRVRVCHLERLKEGTWLHSFAFAQHSQLFTALLENISKSIQIFLVVHTTIKANCAMLEYSSSNWLRLSFYKNILKCYQKGQTLYFQGPSFIKFAIILL